MLVLEAAALQLKELERQLLASNPKLENHLALYLQVLRDGGRDAVLRQLLADGAVQAF